MSVNPRVQCSDLTRVLRSGSREIRVLDAFSTRIEPGEFVAVVGPSGSGKSTLLGLLAGLDRPTAGSVAIDGEELGALGEDGLALLRRRKIGFVFQSFQLLGNLTALENVLVPLELTGHPPRRARERACDLLERVGLAERTHHYPSQLSGGEQQRVALARAWGPRPALLLADEPTGNLDPVSGGRALDLLFELREQEGTTLVLVTHDRDLAARAPRRLRLEAGRLVADEREAPAQGAEGAS